MARLLGLPILALLGVACSGGQPASGSAPPPVQALPVEVVTVTPGPVEEASEYVGTLMSRRSVAILPRVSGYVREILVKPGQPVKAGMVLLRIDARQEAAVLEQSRASLAQAETQMRLAASTRARVESLYKEGIRSRQDYDSALAEEQAARANVQSARANQRAQSVQVAYHDVVAPFAGRVGDVLVKIGDTVTPQTVLTQVDESDRLEIAVEVPVERADQARVQETPVELIGDDGKATVRSLLFFVAPRPDPTTQLVELRAAFANAGQLRSGQRVRVRVVWRTVEALAVPTFAVTRQTGQAFVFVVGKDPRNPQGGEKVERRPVTLGMISGNRWTVVRGLKAGERVAVSRLQGLRDGSPVKATPARSG